MADVDGNRVRECRHPRPKVLGDAIHQPPNVNRLALRVAADALESMRNAIEALEIGSHVRRRGLRRRLFRALLEELDPAGKTRKRRTQLMRGLSSHARPNQLARRIPANSNDVEAEDEENHSRRHLQYGHDAEALDQGSITKVNLAEDRIDDWRVLRVEAFHIRADARVSCDIARLEWQIRRSGRISGGICDDDRNALLDNASRESEKRLRTGAFGRVTERVVDTRIILARALRLQPKVPHDMMRVPENRPEQQGDQRGKNKLRAAA